MLHDILKNKHVLRKDREREGGGGRERERIDWLLSLAKPETEIIYTPSGNYIIHMDKDRWAGLINIE